MHSFIACRQCGCTYPSVGLPYCCPDCGDLFNINDPLQLDLKHVDNAQPGIWRYRHTFGISPDMEAFSLGEGNTPLVWTEIFGRKVSFKCEFLNPTGSFKDRGSTILIGWLKIRGISETIEDSSGNAGVSLAAYAAKGEIKAHVYIPASTSGPKRRQIIAYGAELIPISGTRADVSKAVKTVADQGMPYASHAYLPFNIPGYATIAYEIFEQLNWSFPGAVVVPAGQGGLLLGLFYGFRLLRNVNGLGKLPRLIAVQAAACAPLKRLFEGGSSTPFTENSTLAEGVHVSKPLRTAEVITAIKECHGDVQLVDENSILPGRNELAHMGFYVEPTSAIVWSGLSKTIGYLPEPVVVILTGSGYKYEKIT
jgi:threonine synthase